MAFFTMLSETLLFQQKPGTSFSLSKGQHQDPSGWIPQVLCHRKLRFAPAESYRISSVTSQACPGPSVGTLLFVHRSSKAVALSRLPLYHCWCLLLVGLCGDIRASQRQMAAVATLLLLLGRRVFLPLINFFGSYPGILQKKGNKLISMVCI